MGAVLRGWLQTSSLHLDKPEPYIHKHKQHFVFRTGQKLTGHRAVDGSLAIAVVLRKPEAWVSAVASKPLSSEGRMARDAGRAWDDRIQEAILSELDPAEWNASFRQWIKAASTWKIYPQKEIVGGMTWPQKPGVTLLGDAAHLLTTFGEKGVNLALVDAHALANCIEASLDGSSSLQRMQALGRLNNAVRSYEKSMFRRARHTYKLTKRNQNAVTGNFASSKLLATMVTTKLLGEWASNAVLWWLLGTAVWWMALLYFVSRRTRFRSVPMQISEST